MRNITENFWNSTTGSILCCIWVPVHDDAGDHLESIWIDRAVTACKPQMHEEEDGGDQFEAEALDLILSRCN